jgi:predicted RNA-binding protein with PUA-like domain
MAHTWLLKTEPSTYSFAQLQRDGRTVWDGVTNALALKHLAQVSQGDELFIYHTGGEKAVIGTATALSAAYPDPTQGDPKRLVIDLAPVAPLARPVGLAEIKADPALRTWDLVRLPRLSVVAVAPAQRQAVLRLARQSG